MSEKEELLKAISEYKSSPLSPEMEARLELFYGHLTVQEKQDEAFKIIQETLPIILFLLKAL